MRVERHAVGPEGLAVFLDRPAEGAELAWLGQAGFLLRTREIVAAVDPYLSDYLANKYRGTQFPHTRMMAAPVAPDGIPRLDVVICTHRHSDHMDPGTLPVLADRHPLCRFVVPAAEIGHAMSLGIGASRLIAAKAGQQIELEPGLVLDPLPAAHETLEIDEQGRHRFLGYVITWQGLRLYHSGDCIPYPGLAETVSAHSPDLALLPVNGRDAVRAAARVPGNFTLDEAIDLAREAYIPWMIPHHWGMFDFNTEDPGAIDAAATRSGPVSLLRPDTDHVFRLAAG